MSGPLTSIGSRISSGIDMIFCLKALSFPTWSSSPDDNRCSNQYTYSSVSDKPAGCFALVLLFHFMVSDKYKRCRLSVYVRPVCSPRSQTSTNAPLPIVCPQAASRRSINQFSRALSARPCAASVVAERCALRASRASPLFDRVFLGDSPGELKTPALRDIGAGEVKSAGTDVS